MKRILVCFLLLICVLLVSGCGIRQNEVIDTNGIKRGDLVDYSKYADDNSYVTSPELTGVSKRQTFKTNKELKWVVLSANNEKITLVSSENILDETAKGLGLHNKAGYLHGVDVLDEVCNSLYSSSYGKARSIKTADILSLIKSDKSKRSLANKNELKFTSGVLYDGKKFRVATSSNPITVKSNYDYYSFYKDIELEDLLSKDALNYRPESVYNNVKQYWVANSGINVYVSKEYPTMNHVEYGIDEMTGSVLGLHSTYKSDANNEILDQASYFGIRVVVELNSTVKLSKENNIWVINE